MLRLLRSSILISLLSAGVNGQTIGLAPPPKFIAWQNNGSICSGCLLLTYAAGTTTPQVTYNQSGSPNPTTITLDSSGRFDVWLDVTKSYKFILETPTGGTIYTVDNIQTTNLSAFLPLAGGTMTGAILSSGNTNLGSSGSPFGNIYLSNSLAMGGTTVVDSGRNVTSNNLTVNGSLTSNLLPNANDSLSLGSGTLAFSQIFSNTYFQNANPLVDANRIAYLNALSICVSSGTGDCSTSPGTSAAKIFYGSAPRVKFEAGGSGAGGEMDTYDVTGSTILNTINQNGVTATAFLPLVTGTTAIGTGTTPFGNIYGVGLAAGEPGVSQGIVSISNSSNSQPFVFGGTAPGAGITSGLAIGVLGSPGALYPVNGTTDLGLSGTQFRTLYVGSVTAGGSAGVTKTCTVLPTVVGGIITSC
jgi:hypothetical protein